VKTGAALSLLFAGVFSALLLHTAWQKSPTWDEIGYLGLGAHLLKTGRWEVPASGSHPPLAFYVYGLPALFYPIDWGRWQYPGRAGQDLVFLRSADLGRGNALLLDPRYDGERLFFYCRAAALLFAWLLALVLYRWGARLHGPLGGLFALLLLAFCPNTLAHASLITTDFACAATWTLAVYAFYSLLMDPARPRLAWAGCSLGLALASKLSSLALLPVLGGLAAWFLLFAGQGQRQALGRLRLWPTGSPWGQAAVAYGGVVLLGGLTLWALYGFQVEPYLSTIRSQQGDLETGHEAYLMGAYSSTGWWYYYPVAFLIKTPLPALILAAWGLWQLARDRGRRVELGFLLGSPLALAGLFMAGGKDIGLRYLLPVYPFLFLLAGAALPRGEVRLPGRTFPWRAGLAGALCLWYLVGTARLHPHHLAYFNELVGGPENGYRYLVDSNLDWGQDLKGLKKYMDQHGIERIKLSYFGTVDPALYQLEYEWLPSFVLPAPPHTRAELPTSGLIAISATNLVGVYLDGYGHGKELFKWLWEYEPIARIGYSIFIYDVPQSAASIR